jgi:hypothetical protein
MILVGMRWDCLKIGGWTPERYLRVQSLTEDGRVAWILRLVTIGADGDSQSADVMTINRPDDLDDIANLDLTLAEGKLLLAGLQQEIVAAQAKAHAVRRPDCRSCGWFAECKIIETIELPRCSVRSWCGFPDFAVLDAADTKLVLAGHHTVARHQSWIRSRRISPP